MSFLKTLTSAKVTDIGKVSAEIIGQPSTWGQRLSHSLKAYKELYMDKNSGTPVVQLLGYGAVLSYFMSYPGNIEHVKHEQHEMLEKAKKRELEQAQK